MANVMNSQKRAAIVRCLVEGNSIRATSRMTGACKEAIMKLLVSLGDASAEYQDKTLRELKCERIQTDEIWAFCGCKEGHLNPEDRGKGRGDIWTWTALDPDSKLLVCWHVGLREASDALVFMENLAKRLTGRVQLSSDGLKHYQTAVEAAFGSDVDYGQVIKVFGVEGDATRMEARYSPPKCREVRYVSVIGNPAEINICTSHNERNNLTMRMHMRRFTRLTNAFSKKWENHEAAVNLHATWYNFVRIHQTIRCTPAMEAGVADHVWSIEEMVEFLLP